jgi:hypothetical protein
MSCSKEAIVATGQDILEALAGLPAGVLEQVKDFITFLKEKKGLRRPPLTGKALARKQVAAIKKWAGANLGQGFSGRDHDDVLYGSSR